MSAVRCFWLEPTDQVAIWLRRYTESYRDETLSKCPLPENYETHQNWTRIEADRSFNSSSPAGNAIASPGSASVTP